MLAVPLALLSARKPNGIADRLTMVFSMAGLSVAPYVLALVLVYVFAVKLNVLPAIGWVPPGQSLGQNIRYLILPAVSIGLGRCASTRACSARTCSSRCRARTTW